jgi:nicotinamidase-related amidase
MTADGRSCLMVVDVQKGFVNEHTAHIPARAEALQHDYAHVIATRFVNAAGSPHRTILKWSRFAPGDPETDLAFELRADAHIIEKAVYTAVTPALLAWLRARNIDTVHLCGIDTDACVMKNALDLFEAGIRPVVLADACMSHAGPEMHAFGLEILRRLIGHANVVSDTG